MIKENMDFDNFYIIKKVPKPENIHNSSKSAYWLCKCKKCNKENIYNTP